MSHGANILGIIITFFSIIMYIPQSWKVVKTKTSGNLKKETYLTTYIACILLAILGPMLKSELGLKSDLDFHSKMIFISNITASFFIAFIIFYMFKNNKYIIITIASIWLFAFVFSVLTFTTYDEFKNIQEIKLTLSILASALLGFAYIPQAINVIKTKQIGHISILGTILIILGNLLWALFWIFKIEDELGTAIPQLIFASAITLLQFPILFLGLKLKNKKPKKTILKK